MLLDSYAFNKPIIFKHKERKPCWVIFLNLLFLLAIVIMMVAYIGCITIYFLGYYTLTAEQVNLIRFVLGIFAMFSLFIGILDSFFERFDFHYTVTFDETSFSITFPAKRGTDHTIILNRKISYKFNEGSKKVYMQDYQGNEYRFRYDENFRSFLEKIQII